MTKEKKSPFKVVTEQLPFYPDLTKEKQEPFYCTYVDKTELGDKEEKKMPVFILADIVTGEQVFCLQSYAIKKCIEAAVKELKSLNNVVFQFEFLGKTEVKGKPFNKFNTGYCTLEDYEAYQRAEEIPVKGKKG